MSDSILNAEQTNLLGKIEKMNTTFRFNSFNKWIKANQTIFQANIFLQEFQKECTKQMQSYAKKVKMIQEMRANEMWNEDNSADELCAYAHEYEESRCIIEKEQLNEINSKVRSYLISQKLPVEIYFEDDDDDDK